MKEGVCMPKSLAKRLICLMLSICMLVSAVVVSGYADTYSPLKRDMTSNDVKKMQQRLIELGYLDSGATGYYGSMTVDAVAAFQKAIGFSVNGAKASSEMLSILYGNDAPAKTTGSSTGSTQDKEETTSVYALSYNMNNDSVKKMQASLKELGYFSSNTTGYYGEVTATAVALFLESIGVTSDGMRITAAQLKELYSITSGSDGSSSGSSTPTPEPTIWLPDMDDIVHVTLYYGDTSDSIKLMQQRLIALGYLKTSATGGYWGETAKSVKAFLQAAGMSGDGKTATVDMLELLFSANAPIKGSTVSPTATAAPGGSNTQTTAPAPETLTQLTYSTESSAAVRRMQDRLRELGYFKADSTGNYYRETMKAVRAFLQAVGMSGDGKTATVEMLERLYAANAPLKGGGTLPPPATPTPTPTPKPTPTPVPTPVVNYVELKYGMENSYDVANMQRRLADLGYFKAGATGNYYSETRKALRSFLQAVGMSGNGRTATVEMLRELFDYNAPAYGTTKAPEATATPTPPAGGSSTEKPDASAYTKLSYGMTSNELVYAMQGRLKELGYLKVDPTGGYWSLTAKAVKAFLKAAGMSGDGETATPQMQALLFSASAPVYGSASGSTGYTELRYGLEQNAAVKAAQIRLRELGYFTEAASGNYSIATAEAVAAFQTAAGLLYEPYIMSPAMQQLLFSANAPAYGSTPGGDGSGGTTEQPSLSYDGGPLYYGTNGSAEIKAMQQKLKERGFFSGNATGNYWGETADAVAAFQKYCQLEVNRKLASVEMLAYLFYTGDLDQLIADKNKPSTPVEPDNSNSEFDEIKYAGARTDVLLSKGMADDQVAYLVMRLNELGFLKEIQTSYNDAVIAAVKWFQNTNMLDSDGVAGPATLSILYSKNALSAAGGLEGSDSKPDQVEGEDIKVNIEKDKVQNVDFFSDEGSKYYDRKTGLFRDGATATVTDVKTGKSFRVVRCGGYNHADVEPLRASDTWTIYSLYGEEWSWSRRSIWVTLSDGTTLAASMNGMPHGEGDVGDNNFDGHICIHFLNSRTHGTDNVDPDHQNAVGEAAGK